MKIEQSKVVSLSYKLVSNGEVIETVGKDQPMQFMYGVGYLLPKFEENIAGKKVGDTFDFVLKAADAYGEFDEGAIIDLPKAIFEVEGEFDDETVTVGAQLPMQDNEGNRLQGTVKSIDDTTVVMDFNHPMAGRELHFTGEVVEVRDATPEDMAGGGCGCGCGDDCEDGCDCEECN